MSVRGRRLVGRRALPLTVAFLGALTAPALVAHAIDDRGWPNAPVDTRTAGAAVTRVAGPGTAGVPGPVAGSTIRVAERPLPLGVAAAEPQPAPPATLTIPSIGVETELEHVAVRDDGTLAAPADFGHAGWFAEGPSPGERGPAVLVGHVDSRDGPAVFHRLPELVPGDHIEVTRTDGTVARFAVTDTFETTKDAFPTEVVYGPTAGPTLRLITCTGAFDRDARHYLSNLVVTAVPA
ncbi:MAG TPA: class F sortase [Acidimicrobiales bacterium]|nr:class F sortase [Acidimicrobiales bacterium]